MILTRWVSVRSCSDLWYVGATSFFANLCVNFTRQITSAIGQDPATRSLFIIDQATEGSPDRTIITLDGLSGAITQISKLATVPYHDPLIEIPFDLQWLPNLKTAFVFYTGSENAFDQMMYVYPATGQAILAMIDLAQYQGDYGGNLEFTENDGVEDDDTWSNAAFDQTTNKMYFQCSDVDQDSGEVTITLCQVDIPPHSPAALYYVNIAIEPLSTSLLARSHRANHNARRHSSFVRSGKAVGSDLSQNRLKITLRDRIPHTASSSSTTPPPALRFDADSVSCCVDTSDDSVRICWNGIRTGSKQLKR